MEFTLKVLPDQQAIYFVDQTMATYTNLYNLPSKKELCFVVHELIINAVEAMRHAEKSKTDTIQIHVSQNDGQIKITVMDHAGGIPEENWQDIFQFDLENLNYSDRGRGLFFVNNMVDEIWFEKVSDQTFLVGVSKKIENI